MEVTVRTKACTKRLAGDTTEVDIINVEMSRGEDGVIKMQFGYYDVSFTPEQIEEFLEAVELVKKY